MSLSELKNMIVETKSGHVLGKVKDIVFEIEGQIIAQYIVKPSLLSGKEYLVSRDQIIKITEKKMIVDDSVGLEKSVGSDFDTEQPISNVEPVVMRTE